MRSPVAPVSLAACLLVAASCASPQPAGNPGSGGSSSGAAGSGTTGVAGSGSTGTAGTGSAACTPTSTSNLVNAQGWVCALETPIMMQGAFYGYGDGTTCPASTPKPCSAAGCCMMGATVVDPMYAKWGCGLGLELQSSGGTSPVKSVYSGPVKCFNVTLTGNSGGNPVRISFTQTASPPPGAVAPFSEIPAFTSGWMGQVCFADVTCPSWAVTAGTCTKTGTDGTPVDLQIQVAGGDRAGNFDICISSIEPVQSGSTGTGGSGGGNCNPASGMGTISTQYGDAHVTCGGKDYIVQNNAWGSTAGQTLSYGPGTKFKVMTQAEMRQGNSTPASYPSIWTGAYNSRSTTGSGLPRAVSQIMAGGIQTRMTWADNGVVPANNMNDYNVAYDVWFSTGSGGDPTANVPSGGFLMVWYFDPPGHQPIGQPIQNGAVTIGGRQFNIWYGMNNSKPCVSYVAQQKITSWSFGLGDFIRDAVTRGYVQNSWYLTAVFGGFEIWNGSAGIEITDFAVTVP
jgi:hypothetical protein